MTGRDLKLLADESDLRPIEVCSEANVSMNTLYKVYNDESVRQRTKIKVEKAILRLVQKVNVPVAG